MKEHVKKRLYLCEILRKILITSFMKKEENITSYLNNNYLRKD